MQTQMQSHAQQTLVEMFNSVLAGRAASDAMSEALCQEWLPAMAALLERPDASREHGMHVRRLLVRLGWLLQHLPQAQSIHAGLLDRAIREYRGDWQAMLPLLFSDANTRRRHTDLLDGELLDSLQVAVDSHVYRPVVARRPLLPITRVPSPRGIDLPSGAISAEGLKFLRHGPMMIM